MFTIEELSMIKLRQMPGDMKKEITAGNVVVRIVERRAGPKPRNTEGWKRDSKTVGYVISPDMFDLLCSVTREERFAAAIMHHLKEGHIESVETGEVLRFVMSLFKGEGDHEREAETPG